jgi:hypothetical protein
MKQPRLKLINDLFKNCLIKSNGTNEKTMREHKTGRKRLC